MTHTSLTINELVCIDAYAENGMKGYKIAQKIKRSPQKVYDVLNAIKSGKSVKDYYEQTQENMKRRGAKRKDLSDDDLSYVTDKVSQGWTPDVIIGRGERSTQHVFQNFI